MPPETEVGVSAGHSTRAALRCPTAASTGRQVRMPELHALKPRCTRARQVRTECVCLSARGGRSSTSPYTAVAAVSLSGKASVHLQPLSSNTKEKSYVLDGAFIALKSLPSFS